MHQGFQFASTIGSLVKIRTLRVQNSEEGGQATMDHIEAQLKKIRTKLDDVPAFQKAEVSVQFQFHLPRPFGSLMMTELWPKIVRSWEGWPAAPCWGVIP